MDILKKKFFLILDGVSETQYAETSLFKANKPNIDKLVAGGIHGFYIPETSVTDIEPKTDYVVPQFFGFDGSLNPGRAALEFFDLNLDLTPNTFCFGLKIEDIRNKVMVERIINSLQESGFRFIWRLSHATNFAIKYLFGEIDPSQIELFLDSIRLNLNCNYNIQDLKKIPDGITQIKNTRTDTIFLGWAKGALRGAFKYLGIYCNPFERDSLKFFDWENYDLNYRNWITSQLEEAIEKYNRFILYSKETAFASRFNLPEKKIECIEFVDKKLGSLLPYFKEDFYFIFLSDHSSNFGEIDNPVKNTIYSISKINRAQITEIKTTLRISEMLIKQANRKEIQQQQLISLISSL